MSLGLRFLCLILLAIPSLCRLTSAEPVAESGDRFLERIQHAAFDYFWTEANVTNGLIRDRSREDSKCSIAAVGFGLSAMVIGVEHGWITRDAGCARVARTLETLANGPQGSGGVDVNGYRGWFYHFLEMDTGLRAWQCELSSIDTALLLAGVLDAGGYFDGGNAEEERVRGLAKRLVDRVDWNWMADGGTTFSMGWHPEKGFLKSRWVGYNEAMILYLLALGADGGQNAGALATARKPSPTGAVRWEAWTQGYRWRTNFSQAYVEFAPLFGHQYSHCWVDFRGDCRSVHEGQRAHLF
jgi:hypothetical protein